MGADGNRCVARRVSGAALLGGTLPRRRAVGTRRRRQAWRCGAAGAAHNRGVAVADAGVGSGHRDGVLEGLRRRDRLRGLLLRPVFAVAARNQREHEQLVRRYFPKGTDFSAVFDAEVEAVRDELNGRQRKTLGWMIPSEAMAGLLGSGAAGAIRVRCCFFVDRYRHATCP